MVSGCPSCNRELDIPETSHREKKKTKKIIGFKLYAKGKKEKDKKNQDTGDK